MINTGNSAFTMGVNLPVNPGYGGGNSGAVISPAPALGLSSYQDPDVPVLPTPPHQGVSHGD